VKMNENQTKFYPIQAVADGLIHSPFVEKTERKRKERARKRTLNGRISPN